MDSDPVGPLPLERDQVVRVSWHRDHREDPIEVTGTVLADDSHILRVYCEKRTGDILVVRREGDLWIISQSRKRTVTLGPLEAVDPVVCPDCGEPIRFQIRALNTDGEPVHERCLYGEGRVPGGVWP